MIRRFTISKFVWWYTALAVLCVGGMFMLWSARVWTPAQRHYLWPYLWCSRPSAAPSSQVVIRWLYKTAPGKKPEIALEDEVVFRAANQHSLLLSATARRAGWVALELGPKEQYSAATLRQFLKDQFFDGNNAWLVSSTPLLCGLVSFCFVLLGIAWLESKWRYMRWQLEQTSWFEPMLFILRKWIATAEKLCSLLLALVAHRTQIISAEDKQVSLPIMPPAKPVQPTFSPFGATNRTQKSAFTWSKKDEIE
jgi:hypothetical protein